MDVLGPAVLVLVYLGFFAVWLGSFVYWIIALVEVAKIPEHQFRAAGTEKLVWILVVALTQIIGALIWRFAKRNDVLAAAGRLPPPPAGWYPEPGSGALRWWDGMRWTEHRHAPPPQSGG